MNEYVQSKSIEEVARNHPFPWREQRTQTGLVRMVDATGREVLIFELTALAACATVRFAAEAAKSGKDGG